MFARQKELGVVSLDAELSRHDPDVPNWESLSPEARRLAARMMEVFAGFLSHTDRHIGRVLDFLGEIGEFDNMLIMVVSDNGASVEGGDTGTTNELQFFNYAPEPLEDSLAAIDELGGPTTFNHYPRGWTWPGTPLSAGGSGKPTAAAPATRSWRTGRMGSRRAARRAASTRTSSTWCPPCWMRWASKRPPRSGCRTVPDPRRQLRAHLR